MDLINTCYETTNTVRQLAVYSHLLPAVSILIIGYLAFTHSTQKARALSFFVFTLTFAAWLLLDVGIWTLNNYYVVAALWAPLDYINVLFYLSLLVFLYQDYSNSTRIPVWLIGTLLLMLAYPAMLTITGTSTDFFDETNCEMVVVAGLITFKLVAGWFSILFIVLFSSIKFFKHTTTQSERYRVFILTLASVLFLLVFSSSEFIANLTGVYEVSLYTLFTLPFFVLVLTFSIIEQKTLSLHVGNSFYAKLLFTFFILVAGFSVFLADNKYQLWTTGVNIAITIGFGLLLLRSANREILQREEIQKLARNLEKANARLRELDKQKSEFVSVASHQLRSPLTAIRGYASMLVEGSYGKVDEKSVEPLTRIAESAKLMSESVEDFLSVSRIEGGNMKYEYSDYKLTDQAEHIVDDLRGDGFKKGLLLLYKSDVKGTGIIHADQGKVQQILHNLINNSLKYTPRGTITVFIHDDINTKKIHVDIIDTGIGMSSETIDSLFEKFTRAKNANSVNIKGTGLGLFVAREMARDMEGDITAHSEGEGKGSRFEFTLPASM